MAINPETLLARKIEDVSQRYGPGDTVLYALGLGLGYDPADESALNYVVEPKIVLPTFATVIAQNRDWYWEADTGLDVASSVHADHTLVLHTPLPTSATVTGKCVVDEVIDKGAGRGAIVVSKTVLTDASDGTLYATIRQGVFFRRDGGFGGHYRSGSPRIAIPERPADVTVLHPTSAQAALIYRLSGDFNLLHCDPAAARCAGFKRPILHGLASFGIAGYAIIRTCCPMDAWALKAISCRFTAPAYPGDTLEVQLWRDGPEVRFRVNCIERGMTLIDQGHAEISR